MAPVSSIGNEVAISEDEWEYEYDTEVTEDFYITVDLPPDKREFVPAHVTDIFSGLESAWSFKRRMEGLPYKKRGKRRRRDSNGELINPDGLSDDEVDGALEAHTVREENPASSGEGDEEEELELLEEKEEPEKRFQILDLDTRNPLISYRGSVFSCEWASSIGTEMFFVKRSASDDDPLYEPTRSLNSWDLIGTSSARLLGSDATLSHRPEGLLRDERSTGEPNQVTTPENHFLRRLVDIQVKKNEIEPDTVQFPDEHNLIAESQPGSAPLVAPNAPRGIKVPATKKKRRSKFPPRTALGAHADRLGLLQDDVLDATPSKWPDTIFGESEAGEGGDSEAGQ